MVCSSFSCYLVKVLTLNFLQEFTKEKKEIIWIPGLIQNEGFYTKTKKISWQWGFTIYKRFNKILKIRPLR